MLDGQTIYSDAWVVAKPWLSTLFDTCRVPMAFAISPLESIQSECQYENWDVIRQQLQDEMKLKRHRASTDAFLIQTTFIKTRSYCEPRK